MKRDFITILALMTALSSCNDDALFEKEMYKNVVALTVYDNPVKTRIAPIVEIKGRMYHPLNVDVYGLKLVTKIETGKGGVIQFIGVSRYDGCVWYVITDSLGESTRT